MKRGRQAAIAAAVAAAVSSIPLTRAFGQLAAFPGAVGFGAGTTGARAGALSASSVYVVTNLNNSGTGSFRDAVSQSNRIIVFAVSGYEDITSPISAASNLTILGQTAPGGGFGVYGAEVSFYGQSNDIVQYMRFMDTTNDPNGQGTNNSSGNCINLGNTNNMIFDHDSLEFASYNNIDASGTTGANNLTFENSIIADPIPDQQFNFHWQGSQGTFINNIFANAHNRSILAKGNTQFVNNSIYDYQAGFTTGDSSGDFDFDIVNNYFVAGPSTTNANDAFYQVDGNQHAYASGNLLDSNRDGHLNGSADNSTGATVSNTPLLSSTTLLPTLSATDSYAFNLMHSGDSLTHDPNTFASSLAYDQVDQTVINDVASYGTAGGLVNSQADTGLSNGGLGVIISGNISTNAAKDGIADSWKLTHGLSTTVADSTLLNPLGYTMVEQYAAEIADQYETQTWTAASGEWNNDSGNWPTLSGQSAGTAPGPYIHAVISGTGSADGSATLTTTGATAYSLQIGANGLAAGEKFTVSGGSITVYNTITVGYQNNGTLTMTGGTVTADNVQLGNTVWNGTGNSSSDYTATTYTGTLVLSGGTLNVGVVAQGGGTPSHWTTGAAWTWSGGTLQAGPNGLLVTAPATLGSAGGILDTDGQSATISGVLGGAGGLTKIGAGTAALTGLSTYTGPTTILAGALNPTLTNGGAPSSLGNTSNAAANLILNGGTLMGTGATDRLFTLESNSTLDDTNGMSLTNTGSIALATGANLTLTFTGSNTGHNTFSPSLGDVGGGYVTSVVVSGTGLWDFSNGSKTYSGNTDVTGGTLQTLTANALSPNSTVVISTGADLDFHEHNQTINALSGNGSVSDSFGSGETFTIGAANGSAAFTGAISGDLSVTKVGTGTQAFSGSNSYTGATTVNRGTLKVDFSAAGGPATNIIPATSPLSLGGGTLQIVGDTVAGSAQTFASTTLSAGGSTISVAPVSGTNLPTLNLGAFTPNVGSELELIGPAYNSNPTGAAAVTVASTGTITTTTLGGQNNLWWPNNRAALSTVGLYDWASVVTTPAGTHSILGGSQVSGFYVTENTAIPGNVDTNYDITGNVTTANNGNGPGFSDTLRFNTANPITVTVGNSDNFYNTGILLTPNVGANNVTFAGTSTMAGNGVSGNPGVIDVYQNDTSGQLLLNTTLGNSNGSAQITNYAQAGAGTVMISGTNTFTGGTYLNGGATEISANANLGLGAAAVNLDGGTLVGNANFAMDNSGSNPRPVVLGSSSGGTLAATTGNTMTVDGVVSGGGPLTIGAAALPGSGAGTANPVAVAGNGTVVLSGQNNYTGVTTLSAGEVNVGSPENPGASGPLGEQAANAAGTIFFAGGTLQYSAVNQFDYSGRFSTASNQPISIDTNGQTVSFNTPLVSSGGTLTKLGGGVLTLKVSDTFTGATNVNGGTLKLDFSAPGAPTGNIVSASSGLALGGGTLQVVGNPVGGNTQTFASTTLNAGTSMIWAAPAAGINLPTVALNALGANYGATVELQGPATINGSGNVTATATVTTTTAGSGANGAIANLGAYGSGAYATVGLYDWASTETSTGGAGTSPYTIIGGSQVANFYQTAGVTTGGNYDVNSSGINTIGNQAGASTVRFNSPDALTLTFTSGTVQDLQGILVTPNIGPNNVNITGGGVEFQRDTGPGAAFGVIWQNNTSGYLNFSSAIEGGRQAGQSNGLVQAGPGTVVYGGQNAYELQTYLNGGYSVVSADSGFGNVSDASTVYLTGGTVVGNASFIMDNAGANLRPFVVGTGGGGLAATTGNTLTIDGVVSGSGPLAIGIGTLPGSGPGTANPTAVVGNGTVVLSGANNYGGGTTINSGTLLANSTDTANGSTGAGLVNITAGGTLGGTGQIRGPISVNGIITAGRAASGVAPGTLTANAPGQRTTLAGGGTYDVKIDSASANGVGGTDWDQLIFGAVAVTATSANPFNLTLNSLNPSDAQGAISGLGSSLWTIATTTSAPTGLTLSGNGTTILAVAGTGAGVPTVTSGDSGIFALNTVGFDLVNSVDPSRGYFALELIDTSGTDYSLDVYYSAPEPGSALLVSAGFAGMLLGRRRRRRMGRGMGRGLELD